MGIKTGQDRVCRNIQCVLLYRRLKITGFIRMDPKYMHLPTREFEALRRKYSRYISGVVKPPIDVVCRWAKVANIPVSDLVGMDTALFWFYHCTSEPVVHTRGFVANVLVYLEHTGITLSQLLSRVYPTPFHPIDIHTPYANLLAGKREPSLLDVVFLHKCITEHPEHGMIMIEDLTTGSATELYRLLEALLHRFEEEETQDIPHKEG